MARKRLKSLKYQPLGAPHFDWLTFRSEEQISPECYNNVTTRTYRTDKGDGEYLYYETSGSDGDYNLIYMADKELISRYDVAFDVTMLQDDFDDLFSYPNNDYVSRLQPKSVINSYSKTIYFGSGDVMLRIYEKGKQLKLSGYKKWIRFEFQLRGRKARGWLSSYNPAHIFQSLANQYLNFDVNCSDIDFKFEQPKTADDDCGFLINVCMPHLKKLVKNNIIEKEKIIAYLDSYL